MLNTGSRDAQGHDNNCNNNPKVHPQPMEDSKNLNQSNPDLLISKIFSNVATLKSAYIQLQSGHMPYDPDKIQTADKLVVEELMRLSELKHLYRENYPKPSASSPLDSRILAEIQEQQSLLKTYEVMVKKFQSRIQNRDSEITQLQRLINEANQKKSKLEKKLKQRGIIVKEPEISLNHDLFIDAVKITYQSIHDFSKPMINMMKAAGWDLDAAADTIEPEVLYSKRAHKKYAFESYICWKMFSGFQDHGVSLSREEFFKEYTSMKSAEPMEILSQDADSQFGKFCRNKYLSVVHSKMEVSFFGNFDQRNYIIEGGHPRTAFYQAFLKMAKMVWLLNRLTFSFDPAVNIFQVKKGSEFSGLYMESLIPIEDRLDDYHHDHDQKKNTVGLMVMPGFLIGETVIKSRVYISGS